MPEPEGFEPGDVGAGMGGHAGRHPRRRGLHRRRRRPRARRRANRGPVQGASPHSACVRPRRRARRHGITKALLRECVADAKARGARTISLEVLTSNVVAVAIWRRLGFTDYSLTLASPIDALEARLEEEPIGLQRGVDPCPDRRRAVGAPRGRTVRAAAGAAGRVCERQLDPGRRPGVRSRP